MILSDAFPLGFSWERKVLEILRKKKNCHRPIPLQNFHKACFFNGAIPLNTCKNTQVNTFSSENIKWTPASFFWHVCSLELSRPLCLCRCHVCCSKLTGMSQGRGAGPSLLARPGWWRSKSVWQKTFTSSCCRSTSTCGGMSAFYMLCVPTCKRISAYNGLQKRGNHATHLYVHARVRTQVSISALTTEQTRVQCVKWLARD